MRKKWSALDSDEWSLVIYALNELRNDLISEERYTDAVDELLLKIINAPI